MPGPVENIAARGAGAAARVEPAAEGKTSGKFDQLRQAGATEGAPAAGEGAEINARQLEHNLRQRIDAAKSMDPAKLYGADMGEARKRIQSLHQRVDGLAKSNEASPLRDRLASIENQFAESEKRIAGMGENASLRDLLSMQTEMYKLGQSIEILSKVVDAATSGVKSTLQMQV